MSLLLSGVGGIGSGAAFTPASVTGLTNWYKADTLGLGDGASIASWADISGNTNTATASGTAQPTYKTGIQNGLGVARFNGAANVLSLPNTFAVQSAIFIAYTGYVSGTLISQITTSSAWLQRDTTVWVNANSTSFALSPGIAAGKLYTQEFDYTNNIFSGRVNGASAGSSAIVTAGVGTFNYAVGARMGTGEFVTADICEILIYANNVSSTDRASIENYLKTKWALY